MNLEISNLLDLSHTLAGDYLKQFQYPWQALDGIKELILTLGAGLSPEEYDQPQPNVWVHKTATVAPTAYLGAPCIIGPETEVRHCTFIRGSALVGEHCVVGNSVELKNVILFDNVQTPHYNYVGDSIQMCIRDRRDQPHARLLYPGEVCAHRYFQPYPGICGCGQEPGGSRRYPVRCQDSGRNGLRPDLPAGTGQGALGCV